MARTITVSNVPDSVYERLQAYAEADGVTLPELVRRKLIATVPGEGTLEFGEWLEWLGTLEPIDIPRGAVVEALHAGRAERF
jgi:hypothetical protein